MVSAFFIVLIYSFTALWGFICVFKTNSIKNKNKRNCTLLYTFIIAFLVRVIIALSYFGHETDMNCFLGWSNMVYTGGFSEFYASDAFTDYPPGYMYILYIIGFLNNTFNITAPIAWLTIKLPAILCDLVCGCFVYKIAEKGFSKKVSILALLIFLLNPATITNSALWGQVDSVLTVLVVLMLWLLNEKKTILSYYVFIIAMLIKPQAIFFAPVLLFGIIEDVFLKDFSARKFLKHLFFGLGAILLGLGLCLPFGLDNVVNQYVSTIRSYNSCTLNAWNMWGLLGKNFIEPTAFENAFGYLSIAASVIISAYIFFKKKPENRYFYSGAFICISVFTLSVRMHERYIYPAIILLLISTLLSKNKKDIWLYLAFTFVQFLNCIHVLFFYDIYTCFTPGYENTLIIGSLASVVLYAIFFIYSLKRKM